MVSEDRLRAPYEYHLNTNMALTSRGNTVPWYRTPLRESLNHGPGVSYSTLTLKPSKSNVENGSSRGANVIQIHPQIQYIVVCGKAMSRPRLIPFRRQLVRDTRPSNISFARRGETDAGGSSWPPLLGYNNYHVKHLFIAGLIAGSGFYLSPSSVG